jgi:cytochrome c
MSARGEDPATATTDGQPSERGGVGQALADTAPLRSASPLRWLLVAVPLVVIVGTGTWLATSWSARWASGSDKIVRNAPLSLPPPPSSPHASTTDANRPLSATEILRKILDQPPAPAVPLSSSQPSQSSPSRQLPLPEGPAAPSSEQPSFSPALVVDRLVTADPAAGERLFRMCTACHLADPGGASRIGPNLWGSVGARKASKPGYRYSAALAAKGGSWTYEELALYLHNPRSAVPGTSMSFAGITSPDRLANLIAYMRTLADTPHPLPHAR